MVGLHDENLRGMFFIVIFKGSFWGGDACGLRKRW